MVQGGHAISCAKCGVLFANWAQLQQHSQKEAQREVERSKEAERIRNVERLRKGG